MKKQEEEGAVKQLGLGQCRTVQKDKLAAGHSSEIGPPTKKSREQGEPRGPKPSYAGPAPTHVSMPGTLAGTKNTRTAIAGPRLGTSGDSANYIR